jgi:MFS family permease
MQPHKYEVLPHIGQLIVFPHPYYFQVIYWIGHNGIAYVLDVFIADTSSLENRGLALAFSTSPYIATTFAGPSVAQRFYQTSGWRWAFGAFSIIIPFACAPIVLIFISNRRKAERLGYLRSRDSGRTLQQSVIHYLIQFDGILNSTVFAEIYV